MGRGFRGEDVARWAAQAADEKKAQDVRVLVVTPLTYIADYFVICSGETLVQVRSITEAIEEALLRRGVVPRQREHAGNSGWVLLDYGDVVVHVFREAEREYYQLERLWGDAEELNWRVDDSVTHVVP